ncbi:MAG: PKD domain-containing protein [Bacteroidetes bacterium]|nr:PKD domain-containing protein [Bacteroidota bacterium]
MKKLFSFFAVLMALTFSLQAQTITVHVSGTVLRDSTQAPVVNHQVIITADSNSYGFTFEAIRYTNPNGFYDCTIQNVPSTGAAVTFVVKTKDCDSTYIVKTFEGTTTPATVNFVICNGNSGGCEAGFHSVVDSINYYMVYFYDYSTPVGSIVSWQWDFGDGSPISVVQNPSHIYPVAGTYTVCLTISTSVGCSSTVCHDVTTGQGGCEAHYTFQADSMNLLHIHFWDISTPANLVTTRLWDFGDPASGNNTATTGDPWHVFTHPGIYNVCLTIWTSTGCTSTKCDSITVGNNSTNCENWITYTSDGGFTYTFEGHTHSIYPTTYTWNLGDGSAGLTGHVVTHTYATSGLYTVTLTTLDSTGCAATSSQTYDVHSTTYHLYGFAYLSDSLYVDHGLAELMRADSGMVTVVDSKEIGDSSGLYHFTDVLPGHYYVRVTLLPTSASYGQYVPTYYHDAVNWGNATLIELGQPTNPYNVYMHHVLSYSSGNGTISGTITESGKYSDSGTPAANVEVLLRDVSGQVLAFTMTNANGEFTFASMAMGTYQVYPEMILKNTTPTTVVLSETNPAANLLFAITSGSISGIHDVAAQSDFVISDVYPNPVSDVANLTISSLRSERISLFLYSITGEFISEQTLSLHSGANKVSLPVSDLRKGLYYIKVEKPEGGFIVKKFILGR